MFLHFVYNSTCISGDYYYGMDWFDAMECCMMNGGYLAELISEAEQSLVSSYIVAGKH